MLKVTKDGIQKLGEEIVLSREDLEGIESMFDQYSQGITFPKEESECDGQTLVFKSEQTLRVETLVKEYEDEYGVE